MVTTDGEHDLLVGRRQDGEGLAVARPRPVGTEVAVRDENRRRVGVGLEHAVCPRQRVAVTGRPRQKQNEQPPVTQVDQVGVVARPTTRCHHARPVAVQSLEREHPAVVVPRAGHVLDDVAVVECVVVTATDTVRCLTPVEYPVSVRDPVPLTTARGVVDEVPEVENVVDSTREPPGLCGVYLRVCGRVVLCVGKNTDDVFPVQRWFTRSPGDVVPVEDIIERRVGGAREPPARPARGCPCGDTAQCGECFATPGGHTDGTTCRVYVSPTAGRTEPSG